MLEISLSTFFVGIIKNGIEDLEKAKVYIDKLIESRKEE